jgi:hypothetical protein
VVTETLPVFVGREGSLAGENPAVRTALRVATRYCQFIVHRGESPSGV